MGLKEQIAAKQAEEAKIDEIKKTEEALVAEVEAKLKAEEAEKAAEAEALLKPQDSPIPEVLEPVEEIPIVEETLAVAETPQFRVSGFAYQFKGSTWILKADKMGVYVPQSQEQLDFLIHQVTVGNILFN
jgi:hypothetical protein